MPLGRLFRTGVTAAALATIAIVTFATPVRADDTQDIGVVTAVDRAHATFTCDCAANTLADMSTARRRLESFRTTRSTEFSIRKPFPHGEDDATFAKLVVGKSVIVDYNRLGGVRTADDVTILDEDCRPKFCGP